MPGLTLANTAIITVILFDARDEAGCRVRGQVWVVAENAPGRGLPALPWYVLAGLQQVLMIVRQRYSPHSTFYHDPPQNVYIVILVISVIV